METESIRYVTYAHSEYECRSWGSGCPMIAGFFARVLAGIKAIWEKAR